MTLKEAYEYGKEQLKNAQISDAELDAWYLLEYVTGTSRAGYFMNENALVQEDAWVKYRDAIKTRTTRVPLQHITGVQEFMGLEFGVNPHVLIPRQDTEVLVESVLNIIKPGMKVLDMCTGSGCILISLLNFCRGIQGMGVDISENALEVARENAHKIGVEAIFCQSDLFDKVEGKYDVIVSNPPYIPTTIIQELEEEVKLHDPICALDGKEDGLYFYRKIIAESKQYLKLNGWLYFEIGHDQALSVQQLMEEAGFQSITVKKDLTGLDRVISGVYI